MREVAAEAGDAPPPTNEDGEGADNKDATDKEAETNGPSHSSGRPQVFFDIEINGASAGRIVFEVCQRDDNSRSSPQPTHALTALL